MFMARAGIITMLGICIEQMGQPLSSATAIKVGTRMGYAIALTVPLLNTQMVTKGGTSMAKN
jgi:hypothetical protein